jgi:hypothetical protein
VSALVAVVPLALAAAGWLLFRRFNRSVRWFRVGELIFWDAVLLVVIQLVWLIWF